MAHLDVLEASGFDATIDDPLVTPEPTYLLNTALIGPLAPGEVGGKTSTVFQRLLFPGESLVAPTTAFMQFGFGFPAAHVSSATSTITVTLGNCVATYDTNVNFVAQTSPRYVVNAAQRVPMLCSVPPLPALTPWGRLFLVVALLALAAPLGISRATSD